MKLFLLIFIFSFSAHSSEVVQLNFLPEKTLIFAIELNPKLRNKRVILTRAINFIFMLAPDKIKFKNFMNTKDSDLDFVIDLTTSYDSKSTDILPNIRKMNNVDGDAFSILLDQPKAPIVVRVFVDKILYDEKSETLVEKDGGFARLTALLGHEIYGNVLNYMKDREYLTSPQIKYSDKMRKLSRVKSEIIAFQAGVVFLNKVIKFLEVDRDLDPSVLKPFYKTLEREKSLLAHYSEQGTKLGVTFCSAQLIQLKKPSL